MKNRVLGSSGIKVSPVGLGCMGFSHAYGEPTERSEAVENIRRAYEMGYTFFDTAECYTGANPDGTTSYNEELVGEALRSCRSSVVIATKCGIAFTESGPVLDSSPQKIRESVEGSLKRLGTDTIDLYYQHRIDPKVEPETVAETMKELIKEGKIRAWGISETGEDYLRRAHAVCPVAAIQNRYSMMARDYESLFGVLEELNAALVAFSPMANGFLTARYDQNSMFQQGVDFRSRMPQFTAEGIKANADLLELIRNTAEEKHATPAQISLAWMLCKKPWIIPIPGTRKPARMEENLGSTEIKLTPAEVTALDKALSQLETSGVYGQKNGK